ncbi:MAG TPA: TonB family protein [Micropepsaceae bacterium]|nr:TonB family protein [Micropepsaceae bacterium]
MNRTMVTTIWVSILLHLAAGLWFIDSFNFVAPEPQPIEPITAVIIPPAPPVEEPPPPVREPEPVQPQIAPKPVETAYQSDVAPLPLPPQTGPANPDGPMVAFEEVEPKPDRRVQPDYPERALRYGKDGVVDLLLTILPDGSVADVRVVAVSPDGYGFDREALKAVRRWTYKPQLRGGVAIKRENVRVQVVFQMRD